jgi:hypothetical protein
MPRDRITHSAAGILTKIVVGFIYGIGPIIKTRYNFCVVDAESQKIYRVLFFAPIIKTPNIFCDSSSTKQKIYRVLIIGPGQ